jgi:hypothetical protein
VYATITVHECVNVVHELYSRVPCRSHCRLQVVYSCTGQPDVTVAWCGLQYISQPAGTRHTAHIQRASPPHHTTATLAAAVPIGQRPRALACVALASAALAALASAALADPPQPRSAMSSDDDAMSTYSANDADADAAAADDALSFDEDAIGLLPHEADADASGQPADAEITPLDELDVEKSALKSG